MKSMLESLQQTEVSILRRKSLSLLHDIAGYAVSAEFRRTQEVLQQLIQQHCYARKDGDPLDDDGIDDSDTGDAAGDGASGGYYNPNEPRIPAGQPHGGEWTNGPSGGAFPTNGQPDAGVAEPVYPLETILSGFYASEAIAAVRGAIAFWNGTSTASDKYGDVIQSIEDYFGGPPDRAFLNKKENGIVLMKDDLKIRFDTDGHDYEPHFHIERYDPAIDDWVDEGDQHMYFFKQGGGR